MRQQDKSPTQTGPIDPVMQYLKASNLPLTRTTYLTLAYSDQKLEGQLSAEEEAELPEQIQV